MNLTEKALQELMVGAVAQYAKRKRTDVGRGSATMGAILVKHLEANGYSQRSFASEVEPPIHPSFVNKVCRGTRGISIETLAAWKQLLGNGFAEEWLDQLYEETTEDATD